MGKTLHMCEWYMFNLGGKRASFGDVYCLYIIYITLVVNNVNIGFISFFRGCCLQKGCNSKIFD